MTDMGCMPCLTSPSGCALCASSPTSPPPLHVLYLLHLPPPSTWPPSSPLLPFLHLLPLLSSTCSTRCPRRQVHYTHPPDSLVGWETGANAMAQFMNCLKARACACVC